MLNSYQIDAELLKTKPGEVLYMKRLLNFQSSQSYNRVNKIHMLLRTHDGLCFSLQLIEHVSQTRTVALTRRLTFHFGTSDRNSIAISMRLQCGKHVFGPRQKQKQTDIKGIVK